MEKRFDIYLTNGGEGFYTWSEEEKVKYKMAVMIVDNSTGEIIFKMFRKILTPKQVKQHVHFVLSTIQECECNYTNQFIVR